MPSLCIDDLVNALTFTEGRPAKAAGILRAGSAAITRQPGAQAAPREPYHRS
jgi:hypothetical protein